MDRDFTKLVAGEKVFVAQFLGSWGGPTYTPGIVQKITPSGMIDVVIGFGKEPTRFNPDGRSRGKYTREQIDGLMTFEEREADLAKRDRIQAANNALQTIAVEKMRNPEQLDLVKEVERLRGLLDAADKLIEAI